MLCGSFEPQFNEVGKPTITTETFFTEPLPDNRCRSGFVASSVSESGAKCVRRHARGRHSHFKNKDHGDNVRIEVSDTGKGLAPEELCAALYAVLHDKQQGTGLGLAIVAIGCQRSSRRNFCKRAKKDAGRRLSSICRSGNRLGPNSDRCCTRTKPVLSDSPAVSD